VAGASDIEKERARDGLATGDAATTPPYPPFARGGKRRNEIRGNARVAKDQLFISPPQGSLIQLLDLDVLELHFHGRPDVELERDDTA